MLAGKFEVVPEDVCQEMLWNYKPSVTEYNISRPVRSSIPKYNPEMVFSDKLFRFKPENDLIDIYLTDLQICVNKLAKGIVVKGYYAKASKLMERI